MWWLGIPAALAGYTVHDLAPSSEVRPVLLIVTPGFSLEGYLPLARALVADGHDVHALELDCSAVDAAGAARRIAEVAATLPDDKVVVAHGVGATLALMAAPETKARKYVLLAPVLDVWPVASTAWLGSQEAGVSVDLSKPVAWRGAPLADTLLGPSVPPLGCAPAPLASEVLGWIREQDVPVALEQVAAPVWMAVSLGDDVAAVEAVVPASRRLPDRELVRLGLNNLDRQDYSHGEMLMADVPVRAAVRAARW